MNRTIENLYESRYESWTERMNTFEKIRKIQNKSKSNKYFDQNIDSIFSEIIKESNEIILESGLRLLVDYFNHIKNGHNETVGNCFDHFFEKLFKSYSSSIRGYLVELFHQFCSTNPDVVFNKLMIILNVDIKNTTRIKNCLELVLVFVYLYSSIEFEKLCERLLSMFIIGDDSIILFTKKIIGLLNIRFPDEVKTTILGRCSSKMKTEINEEIVQVALHHNETESDDYFGEILQLTKPKWFQKQIKNLKNSVEEVDLLPLLTDDFFTNISGERKIRKATLEKLEEKVGQPNIAIKHSNYRELIRKLCEIVVKDNQVIHVTMTLGILSHIANKLTKGFGNFSVQVIEACIEKFKEKRRSVLSEIRACIDAALQHLSNLDSVIQVLLDALDNKNPNIRLETICLLNRICQNEILAPSLVKHSHRVFPITINKLCGDGASDVRDMAYKLTVALIILKDGRSNFMRSGVLDDVDPAKLKKINEYFRLLEDPDESLHPSPPIKPNTFEAKLPKGSNSPKKIHRSPPAAKTTIVNDAKPNKKPLEEAKLSSGKKTKRSKPEINLTNEEITETCSQIFKMDVRAGLLSAKWQDRMNNCVSIIAYLSRLDNNYDDNAGISHRNFMAILDLLFTTPGLRDKNLPTLKKKLEAMDMLFQLNNGEYVVPQMFTEKCLEDVLACFGDSKLDLNVTRRILTSFVACSANNKSSIFIRIMMRLPDVKTPTCIIEVLSWLSMILSTRPAFLQQTLILFKDVIIPIKQLLKSSNKLVRARTIDVIEAIYAHSCWQNREKVTALAIQKIVSLFSDELPVITQQINCALNAVFDNIKKEQLINASTVKEEERQKPEVKEIQENISVSSAKVLPVKSHRNSELSDGTSVLDESEEDIGQRNCRDEARQITIDLYNSLSYAMTQYSKTDFLNDLGDVLTNIACFGEQNMKDVFILLQQQLRKCLVTKNVEVQTDPIPDASDSKENTTKNSKPKIKSEISIQSPLLKDIRETAISKSVPVSVINNIYELLKDQMYSKITEEKILIILIPKIFAYSKIKQIRFHKDPKSQNPKEIIDCINLVDAVLLSNAFLRNSCYFIYEALLRGLQDFWLNGDRESYWNDAHSAIRSVFQKLNWLSDLDYCLLALLVVYKDLIKIGDIQRQRTPNSIFFYFERILLSKYNDWNNTTEISLSLNKYMDLFSDVFEEYDHQTHLHVSTAFRLYKTFIVSIVQKYGVQALLDSLSKDKDYTTLRRYLDYAVSKINSS